MERNINMNEVSDGKLYGLNDMVKVNCNECKGCSACCRGMGNSIVLDPFDMNRITAALHKTVEELLTDYIEFNVVDDVILPNIKMSDSSKACNFLNNEGRCSIHAVRPGICRIFPLGRYYENHTFQYFLQIHECKSQSKTKVKVRKWIDTADAVKYQQFIIDWHYYLKDIQNKIKNANDENKIKDLNLSVLTSFYMKPYDETKDFYTQFYERLRKME